MKEKNGNLTKKIRHLNKHKYTYLQNVHVCPYIIRYCNIFNYILVAAVNY